MLFKSNAANGSPLNFVAFSGPMIFPTPQAKCLESVKATNVVKEMIQAPHGLSTSGFYGMSQRPTSQRTLHQ